MRLTPFFAMALAPYVALGAVALSVSGCATGYQSNRGGLIAGYDELKLSADTYRISVNGNAYTSQERARRIAMLRAAELAIEGGFERFLVLDGEASSTSRSGPTIIAPVGRALIATGGGTYTFPESALTVKMLTKGSPGFDGALDAQLIASQLRPQLQ